MTNPTSNQDRNFGRKRRAAAIIPARYASTRFPGKPLALLCGKPMIQHVYERVCQTEGLLEGAVWVATDDERIFDAVTHFGGRCVMTGDCRTGTDRVRQAARQIDCDVVLNVQGDEPLISPECLSRLLEAFDDPEVEMATLRRPLEEGESNDPNTVKLVCALSGDALYFSRSLIPFPRKSPVAPVFAHVGVYAYTKAFLEEMSDMPSTPLELTESLEQLRVLEHGRRIRTVLTHQKSIGVDTPDDLSRAEKAFGALLKA